MSFNKILLKIVAVVLLGISHVSAQQYGFEWIKPNTYYYKFKITKEGVYKIDSTLLASVGINLIGVNPNRFQLIRDGEEKAIFVQGDGDGIFNANDFIEFYANKNDGKLDVEIYQAASDQPHNYTSLITDTAFYFFAILPDTTTIQTKRLQIYNKSNYSSFTAEPYFIFTQNKAPVEEYFRGTYDRVGPTDIYYLSEYVGGESWTGLKFGFNDPKIYSFDTRALNTNGPSASIKTKVIGVSDADADTNGVNHHLRISIAPGNSTFSTIKDTSYLGLVQNSYSIALSNSQLGTAATHFKYESVDDLGLGSDYSALSYASLTYSRNYDLLGNSQISYRLFPIMNGTETYIKFSNFGKSKPSIIDIANNKKISCNYSSGDVHALIENNNLPKNLFLYDTSDILNINEMKLVDLSPIDEQQNYEYIIISHERLANAANEYKNYRALGFNKILLINSSKLFDRYFYGYPHPLALKRFCKHLYEQQISKPKYLLLLGRGFQNNLVRNNSQNAYNNNLVPSIGEPSSDNMFTIGLDQNAPYAPAIPTGRIPALNELDAKNYLDKLKDYESDANIAQEWHKNILHLSGGSGPEQLSIINQINSIKPLITDTSFGANITTFSKKSSVPVDPDLKNILLNEINKGKSMMTFLGHGSLTVLDVDFGTVADLNNYKKYPVFYFNGCNIGNANDIDPQGTGNIYGKYYLCNYNNKGVVAWLAHSNLTLTTNLFHQMNVLYANIGKSMYGNPIGDVIKKTLTQTTFTGDKFSVSHSYQLLLQGDPFLKIHSPPLPDYEIANADLFLSPTKITAQNDSFSLKIIIKNLGKAIKDSIQIKVVHTLPNNTAKHTYDSLIFWAPYYKDTATASMKGWGKSMVGENIFDVTIDPNNIKTEITHNNNSASLKYVVVGSGLYNILPFDCAIIKSDTVTLISQNNDLFIKNAEYEFEMDTSLNFSNSSSFYQKSPIIKTNDLAKWKVVLPSSDSIVYFWRSRLNLPLNQGGEWYISSFTKIINGNQGFRQSKFEQYQNALSIDKIKLDTIKKQLSFIDNELVLGIQNRRFDHRNMGVIVPYQLNAGVGTCISEGTVVLVFEPNQIDFPYELPNYPFNCSFVQNNKQSQSIRYYPFATKTAQGKQDLTRLIDSIPSGYYVAMFSRYNSDIINWDVSTKNALSKIGSVMVSQIQNKNTAWAIIGQKNAALGFATEDTVCNDSLGALFDIGQLETPPLPNQSQDVNLLRINKALKLKWHTGSITSKALGPANAWNKLLFNFISTDISSNEKFHIDIIGVTKNGSDSLIARTIKTSPFNLQNIDAKKIPFLKLKATFEDSLKRSPHQFGFWQIEYQPVTEGKLNVTPFETPSSAIEQGDSFQIKLDVQNISDVNFDSTSISYKIFDENRVLKYSDNESILRINPDSTIRINKNISTLLLEGNNTINILLNPEKNIEELSYLNNFISKNFDVKVDKSNPYLDVTFDGVRIMNNDIVSPSPVITITSTDDNKFKLQNDTSTFSLWLKNSNQFDFSKINLSNPELQFVPADKKNKATLIYHPKNLCDSECVFTLKVQSKDASQNNAGLAEYKIDFTVINKSTITHFFPYPNPGTTNIRFVFTLTGSIVPDDFLIRIMTVTGKVLREINKQEFGHIKIGNNISEFAWDGTDMYGDRLANGVYLYQVLTKINDKNIDERKMILTDKYFTQGVGKIYLMK